MSAVTDPPKDEPPRSGAPAGRPTRARRVLGYLRARPVLCLLLLTPGIPEYLSSSSSLAGLVLFPVPFFLFLGLNLGLYGPGVLLIREAVVRWKKGWPTVLALGAAYGILEEGIALSTFYNSNAAPVANLGFYGHWVGVNWVWIPGVVMVHMVYSIGLPILLLGLALPATRGQRLVSARGVRLLFAILAADVVLLMAIVYFGEHFWMGDAIFLASLAAIAGLLYLAYRLPTTISSRPAGRGLSPSWLGTLGALAFPSTLVTEGIAEFLRAPPWAAIAGVLAVMAGLLHLWRWGLGTPGHERALIATAAGLLLPIMVFGIIASARMPVVLLADIAALLFLRWLWKRYPAPAARSIGVGVTPPAVGPRPT